MRQRTCFAVFFLSVVGPAQLYGGKPGGCQDIATQWTVNDRYIDGTTLNAIRADSLGPYKNGQSGVTATIQICNGSNDAVLMTGSSRQLTFTLPRICWRRTLTHPPGPPALLQALAERCTFARLRLCPPGTTKRKSTASLLGWAPSFR